MMRLRTHPAFVRLKTAVPGYWGATDARASKRLFREITGRVLDLEVPKSFNEKISWLKLYGMTPLHSFCADKITAPAYVASRIGPNNVAEREFATYDLDDITPERIESRACVIKTNHDCGGVFLVENTSSEDWPRLRETLKERLDLNFYHRLRERQYKSIRPGVLVEELLRPRDKSMVSDVRVYCLNGSVEFIRLTQYDFSCTPPKKVLGVTLDPNWSLLPFGYTPDLDLPQGFHPENHRPQNLIELIDQARVLSEPFPFVRVDFIEAEDRYLVGELTFTPHAGLKHFHPYEFDCELGERLDHARPTHNWAQYLDAARKHLGECKILS